MNARLEDTDMSGANLRGTGLRCGDLEGANPEKAVWKDGSVSRNADCGGEAY